MRSCFAHEVMTLLCRMLSVCLPLTDDRLIVCLQIYTYEEIQSEDEKNDGPADQAPGNSVRSIGELGFLRYII